MTPRRLAGPRNALSRSAAAVLAFASIALPAAIAEACPVCFSARPGTRLAYVGTAVLMSLLPLAMFGIVGWWIRRAVREHDEKLRGAAAPSPADLRERSGTSARGPAVGAPSRTEAATIP